MADQKITQLTSLTASEVSDSDVVAIVDVSPTATTKKMTRTEFFKNTPNIGIGTSSPSEILHIQADAPNIWVNAIGAGEPSFNGGRSSNGGLLLTARAMNTSSKYTPAIMFGSTDTDFVTNTPRIGAAIVAEASEPFSSDTSGNMHLSFWTRDGSTTNQNAAERMRITSDGNVGIGTSSPSERLSVTGNVTISGSLSKGSGSFRIDHPLKPDTHHLVHSFIEGPQADNIYRGKTALVDGAATVNLDEAARMTEGTFVALNGNIQCFTTNETGWTAVRGTVSGNILAIEAQDQACTDTVSWLVIGERHDQHMLDTAWTDEQGRIIVEPEKVIVEEEPENVIVEEVPE